MLISDAHQAVIGTYEQANQPTKPHASKVAIREKRAKICPALRAPAVIQWSRRSFGRSQWGMAAKYPIHEEIPAQSDIDLFFQFLLRSPF